MVLLLLTILIALLILSIVRDFKRIQYTRTLDRVQATSKEYYRFLNSLVLGFGSDESARELCKAEQLWCNTSCPEEQLAALHIADGVAKIALSEARDMVDTEAYLELVRQYRYHKNYILWAVKLVMPPTTASKSYKNSVEYSDKAGLETVLKRTKAELLIRYSHLMKPFPKSWESRQP